MKKSSNWDIKKARLSSFNVTDMMRRKLSAMLCKWLRTAWIIATTFTKMPEPEHAVPWVRPIWLKRTRAASEQLRSCVRAPAGKIVRLK